MPDLWSSGATPNPQAFVNPMDTVNGPLTTQEFNAQPMVHAGRKALNNIFDLSQRGLQSVRAPKGKKLNVLIHGETPAQSASNDAWWYQQFGMQDRPGDTPLDKTANAVNRTLLDIGMDPATLATIPLGGAAKGRTIGGVLLNEAERHSLPLAMKAGAHLPHKVQQAASLAHDLGVDSEVKRELAKEFGPDWLKEYANLYSARNAGKSERHEIERAFVGELDDIMHGLDENQQDELFRAVDAGTIGELPEGKVKEKALQYQRMTQTMEHLQGTEGLRQNVAGRGLSEVPSYAQPFASLEPRNLQDVSQVREAYVPTSRYASAMFNAGEQKIDELLGGSPITVSDLERPDVHLRERNLLGYENPKQAYAATRHRIKGLANSVAGHDTKQRVGERAPYVQQFFENTFTPEGAKTKAQHAADLARTITDFEKAGIFITPTGHGSRVAALGAVSDPSALLGAMGSFAGSYAKALPKALKQGGLKGLKDIGKVERAGRIERMRPSINAGAVQTESIDRQTPFVNALNSNPVTKPLGKLYEASGHVLWHFDDELKHAAFQNKVARGMDPAEAALEVGADLVDYGNRSGLVKGSSSVIPFGTWRTKMPLAVMRLMIKYPGRITEGARLAPAAFGGEQDGYTTGLPYADFANMLHAQDKGAQHPTVLGLAKYARGAVAPWLRAALNVPAEAAGVQVNHKHNWLTGGMPSGQYIINQLPLLGTALEVTGNGPFHDPGSDAALSTLTTIRRAHPAPKRRNASTTPVATPSPKPSGSLW